MIRKFYRKASGIMKRKTIGIFAIMIILMLTGCATSNDADLEEELEAKNIIIKTLEERIVELESAETPLEEEPSTYSLLSTVVEVVNLLKNEDMTNLSTHIHPSKGVRFSPYGYIDLQTSQLFNVSQVSALMTDTQIYTWGNYDGIGDPIELTFNDYYDKFIYDEDFANPHMIGNNHTIGTGNTINNIEEVFTNGVFVEFHFTGFDAQYEGMDWKSLRLVFEEDNGTWYLVGIVHDQWTI